CLDVASLGHGDNKWLVFDEVLDTDVAWIENDFSLTRSCEFATDFTDFSLDDSAQGGVVVQDRFEFGNGLAQFFELGFQVSATKASELHEAHVEDVFGLLVTERKRLGAQTLSGF